ncbi:MAG: hypothetical protein AAF720_14470 [Pseudomonadota bacterium]
MFNLKAFVQKLFAKKRRILTVSKFVCGIILLYANHSLAYDIEISNPGAIVADFDYESIKPVLSDLNITATQAVDENGRRYIEASAGSSFVFNIMPSACLDHQRHKQCAGAHFISVFKGKRINLQSVAAFNQQFAFSTAGVLPGGRDAYLGRYEIADYGIPRGNLASSIAGFIYLSERFRSEILTSDVTAARSGFADDLAATRLNQQTSAKMGIVKSMMSLNDLHHVEFERSVEFVKFLLGQDEAAVNKITNTYRGQ